MKAVLAHALKFRPRFSLRTLAIFLLLVTAGVGLWCACGRGPWYEEKLLPGHKDCSAINRLKFSADGRKLTTWGLDNRRRVLDVETGACLEDVHEDVPRAPRTTVTCETLGLHATAIGEGGVELWREGSPRPGRFLQGHSRPVYYLSFSRDGSRLITLGLDKTARVWDVSSAECIAVASRDYGFFLSADMSDDNRRFVGSAGGVFDAETGRLLAHVGFESELALRLPAFSLRHPPVDHSVPEGMWSTYGALIVGAETEQDFAEALLPEEECYAVAFSPCGDRAATAGCEERVRIHRRTRPERWWGVFWLWEFWLTVAFAALFIWSVIRDRRCLARTG